METIREKSVDALGITKFEKVVILTLLCLRRSTDAHVGDSNHCHVKARSLMMDCVASRVPGSFQGIRTGRGLNYGERCVPHEDERPQTSSQNQRKP